LELLFDDDMDPEGAPAGTTRPIVKVMRAVADFVGAIDGGFFTAYCDRKDLCLKIR